MKTNKHGGARKGAGGKHKYNEPTTTVAFRLPISKVAEIKKLVDEKKESWLKN